MSRNIDPVEPEEWSDEDLKWAAQFPWMLEQAGLTEEDVAERLGTGEDEGESKYAKLKNDDLRVELVERGLSVDGKKDELVARLVRDDNDELTDEDKADE